MISSTFRTIVILPCVSEARDIIEGKSPFVTAYHRTEQQEMKFIVK